MLDVKGRRGLLVVALQTRTMREPDTSQISDEDREPLVSDEDEETWL